VSSLPVHHHRSLPLAAVAAAAAALLAAGTAHAGTAPASPPSGEVHQPAPAVDRSGFTLELGIGYGLTHLRAPLDRTANYSSLAGLDLGVGVFVTERTALSLRIAGTSFMTPGEDAGDAAFVAGFLGPSVQYWFVDRAFFSAGAGVAVFGTDDEMRRSELGGAFDVRAGYSLYAAGAHSVQISAELTRGFYAGNVAVDGLSLQLGWQLL